MIGGKLGLGHARRFNAASAIAPELAAGKRLLREPEPLEKPPDQTLVGVRLRLDVAAESSSSRKEGYRVWYGTAAPSSPPAFRAFTPVFDGLWRGSG
jgi:hypothetical protein